MGWFFSIATLSPTLKVSWYRRFISVIRLGPTNGILITSYLWWFFPISSTCLPLHLLLLRICLRDMFSFDLPFLTPTCFINDTDTQKCSAKNQPSKYQPSGCLNHSGISKRAVTRCEKVTPTTWGLRLWQPSSWRMTRKVTHFCPRDFFGGLPGKYVHWKWQCYLHSWFGPSTVRSHWALKN